MSELPAAAFRIDVRDAVGRAYRTVFDRAPLAFDLVWLPFGLVCAAELLALAVDGGGLSGRLLSLLIRAAGFLLFATVFIVRWQRFLLLGETRSDRLLPPGWAAFVGAVIKLAVLAGAGFFVLGLINALLGLIAALPPGVLTAALASVGGAAVGFVGIGVSLVFPAAAIERPISIVKAWDRLSGNYWRLFACAFTCYLPLAIVQLILGRLAVGSLWTIQLACQAISLAVGFAGIAVIAALLCEVYRGTIGNGHRSPGRADS
jgi:hypothetical protein